MAHRPTPPIPPACSMPTSSVITRLMLTCVRGRPLAQDWFVHLLRSHGIACASEVFYNVMQAISP